MAKPRASTSPTSPHGPDFKQALYYTRDPLWGTEPVHPFDMRLYRYPTNSKGLSCFINKAAQPPPTSHVSRPIRPIEHLSLGSSLHHFCPVSNLRSSGPSPHCLGSDSATGNPGFRCGSSCEKNSTPCNSAEKRWWCFKFWGWNFQIRRICKTNVVIGITVRSWSLGQQYFIFAAIQLNLNLVFGDFPASHGLIT